MTTTFVEVDIDAYVNVSSADNVFIQCRSPSGVRVHFGATQPTADTQAYHYMDNKAGIVKQSDFPAGAVWVRADRANNIGVVVSE